MTDKWTSNALVNKIITNTKWINWVLFIKGTLRLEFKTRQKCIYLYFDALHEINVIERYLFDAILSMLYLFSLNCNVTRFVGENVDLSARVSRKRKHSESFFIQYFDKCMEIF